MIRKVLAVLPAVTRIDALPAGGAVTTTSIDAVSPLARERMVQSSPLVLPHDAETSVRGGGAAPRTDRFVKGALVRLVTRMVNPTRTPAATHTSAG